MKTLRSPAHAALRAVLKQARRDGALTQDELADRLGWIQSRVAKIETGERRVDPVELVAWAKGCGIRPKALFALFVEKLEAN